MQWARASNDLFTFSAAKYCNHIYIVHDIWRNVYFAYTHKFIGVVLVNRNVAVEFVVDGNREKVDCSRAMQTLHPCFSPLKTSFQRSIILCVRTSLKLNVVRRSSVGPAKSSTHSCVWLRLVTYNEVPINVSSIACQLMSNFHITRPENGFRAEVLAPHKVSSPFAPRFRASGQMNSIAQYAAASPNATDKNGNDIVTGSFTS